MSIEAWGAIGEILGAIAVFASLIFVGFQLRGNTREQRLTRANEAADNYSRFQVLLIENPEFRDLWIKGRDDISVLTPSELLGLGAYLALWVDSVIRNEAQRASGHGADNNWDNAKNMYKPIIRYRGPFQWWQRARTGYTEEIRAKIDQLFAEVGQAQEDTATND